MYEKYKQLLTIGITAFNEGRYIRETIESCVNQAGTILICDNASNDNTQEICEQLAKKYSNIKYFRTEKDFGKNYGYMYVLNNAKTKYFMWCGPHDLINADYSSNMIHMLENSDAVGCYPKCRSFTIEGETIGIYEYWYSQDLISPSSLQRVYSLIKNLHNVGMFYGIFKTEIAKKYGMTSGVATDHSYLCNMASEGKLIYCPEAIFSWRETKLGLDHKELMKTWVQTLDTSDQPSLNNAYKISKSGQLLALKNCNARNIAEILFKPYLIYKAKRKLNKRFGN